MHPNLEQEKQIEQMLSRYRGCSTAAQAEAKVLEHQIQEYSHEAERLTDMLSLIGLPLESLSPETRSALNQLASVAATLGLSTAVNLETTVLAAWGQLRLEEMHMQRLKLKLDHSASALRRSLHDTQSASSHLEACMAAAKSRQAEQQADLANAPMTIVDFKDKTAKYTRVQAEYRAHLAKCGFDEKLSHSHLVEAHNQLEGLRAALGAAQADLEQYQDLPASQVGAEIRLKQSREALHAVKSRLEQGMADL